MIELMDLDQKDINIRVKTGTITKVFLILALFILAFILRDILLVVMAAVVIASSIEPVIKWCREWKIARLPAVIVVYVGLGFFLVATFYYITLPLLNEISVFLNDLPNYVSSVDLWNPIQESFLGSQPLVKNLSDSLTLSKIVADFNAAIATLSGGFVSAMSRIFGGLSSLVLIIVLSFYLAVQENGIGTFLKTITPIKHRKYVVGLWNRAEIKIGLWLQGQLILAIVIAVLVFLGLTLLGIKHALILAFLAGVFELIPLFGPILAAIPGIFLAFFDKGFTFAVIVAGFYLIVQQFENNLIYPLVIRKVTGVPPIIIILAIVVGFKLAGFLGVLLSVPVATIIMEFLNDLQKEMLLQEKQASQE